MLPGIYTYIGAVLGCAYLDDNAALVSEAKITLALLSLLGVA